MRNDVRVPKLSDFAALRQRLKAGDDLTGEMLQRSYDQLPVSQALLRGELPTLSPSFRKEPLPKERERENP